MQKVTAEHALALARAWFDEPDNLACLLRVMRRRSSGFVPTFLSAYARCVGPLPPELAAEVDEVRDRSRRLRQVHDAIVATVPGTVALKGIAVADLYPTGLVRRSGDLDLLAPDRASAWRVAQVAVGEHGLRVRSVTTFPARRGAITGEGLMVNMAGVPASAFEDPLSVDVCTHAVVGNGSTVPAWHGPAARPPGPAEHLVAVAAEALEQPFNVKDVFDATVLSWRLTAGDGSLSAAWRLAADAGLEPELAALLDVAARHGMPVPAGRRRTGPARARRGLGLAAATAAHPLQVPLHALQSAEVLPKRLRRPRRALWSVADRRLPVTAAVRSALFRYGIPVEVDGTTDRPVLRSPLGTYLLVNGSTVDERWFDDGLTPRAAEDPDLFGPISSEPVGSPAHDRAAGTAPAS